MKKTIYFENLNALRFLCFLSVFFFHCFHTEYSELKDNHLYLFIKKDIFGNGNLGVNFFFVLSGFLITYLLLEEKVLRGQIHLKNFWKRRILRIWPLFYLCLLFGFVAFPLLKQAFGQTPNETANIIYYLTFLNNFDFINHGLPDASTLGVLWSVAIEEQFYLVWPLIIFFIPTRKLWIPFLIILLISLLFRTFNDSYVFHEYHTLSCIGDMVIGATGAWLVFTSAKFKTMVEKFNKFSVFVIYLLFLFIFLFRDEVLLSNYYLRIFERILIAAVILFIILEQNYSRNSFFKLSRLKYFSKLGIISYGLYCLHFIGILITINITDRFQLNKELWQVILLETSFALALTILISWISYRFYEKPFLKLKEKFSQINR